MSACISKQGKCFLWGSATNKQLGNAGKTGGLRNVGLEDSDKGKLEFDDGEFDEEIPWRLDVAAVKNKKVHRIEFGGQHTLLLRQE